MRILKKALQKIKNEGDLLKNLSIEELLYLKEKIIKSLDREKWFALVQETSARYLDLRHYDTQLMGGLLLDEGKVIEMKTGEGKTLCSTLSVSFNALQKKGVHVVTVNDYLAERDAKWMGKLYSTLGLSTGLVLPTQNSAERQKNYNEDITYVTNSTVVFDYLKDNLLLNTSKIAQRPLNYCLIDEIDSVLIDEARVPLIISESSKLFPWFLTELTQAKKIGKRLEENVDFEIDKKKKEISLTEKGYAKIEKIFSKKDVYSLKENTQILSILNAIKVNYFYLRDIDYLVMNNKIVLIDEFTGRLMTDRRWSFGIQEAIEAKEGIFSPLRSSTLSAITYQSFFPEYQKISGMTGTALSSAKEFEATYQLKVLSIEPFKQLIRKDLSDEVYENLEAKWQGILEKGKKSFRQGQPILLGTASIENSEFLADMFSFSGVPHTLLNARPQNAKLESKIIAQAGQLHSLTIATNMAGRGTDIILGGNLDFRIKESIFEILKEMNHYLFFPLSHQNLKMLFFFSNKQKKKTVTWKKIFFNLVLILLDEYKDKFLDLLIHLENLPYSLKDSKSSLKILYTYLEKEFLPSWKKEKILVQTTGGLFVLGSERSENLRIDDQLRGRAGRQGDPGISQFLISLNDNLFQRYSTQNLKLLFGENSDLPLQSPILDYSLREIQKKIETINYETRQNLLTYNELEDFERKLFFTLRTQLLLKNFDYFLGLFFKQFFLQHFPTSQQFFVRKKIEKRRFFPFSLCPLFIFSFLSCCFFSAQAEFFPLNKLVLITHDLFFSDVKKYNFQRKNRLFFPLIHTVWADQLQKNSFFRESVRWRSYAQKNPIDEFNLESFKTYNALFTYLGLTFLYHLQFEESRLNISPLSYFP